MALNKANCMPVITFPTNMENIYFAGFSPSFEIIFTLITRNKFTQVKEAEMKFKAIYK